MSERTIPIEALCKISTVIDALTTRIEALEGKALDAKEPPASEPLPKWIEYHQEVYAVTTHIEDRYKLRGLSIPVPISDCTPVRVIDEEKWTAVKDLYDIVNDIMQNPWTTSKPEYRLNGVMK
jgi:hypothetical protein